MIETDVRKAFEEWCKSAPDGWNLDTPSRWMAWEAGAEWARKTYEAAGPVYHVKAPAEGIEPYKFENCTFTPSSP